MTSEILCPREREKLQIGHYTQNFAISLSEELVNSIKMSSVSLERRSSSSRSFSNQFEDNDVGYIVGKVDNHVSSSIPILRPLAAPKIETNSQESQEGGNEFLKALPQTTLIGDLRLTTLKTQLVKLGLSAEFAGEGVLVCSTGKTKGNDVMDVDTDVVAVRKRGKERLLVEGAPSDVYYTVRQAVYNLHAVVSA
jgi:cleavage and polyadenylation specificity factor subunit 2